MSQYCGWGSVEGLVIEAQLSAVAQYCGWGSMQGLGEAQQQGFIVADGVQYSGWGSVQGSILSIAVGLYIILGVSSGTLLLWVGLSKRLISGWDSNEAHAMLSST